MNIHFLANPNQFMKVARRVLPWLLGAMGVCFAWGLYLALLDSPPDYQQGEMVRVMYIHVPAASLSMGIYMAMAAASAAYLVWKHPLADVAARMSAPIGAGFTLITLITGSLWGKPTWGTYWEWDARMTSVLILFFIYLGYIVFTSQADQRERIKKAGAIWALVGAVNIPIIKFSVEWWHTLHQPASLIRAGGPSIDGTMMWPLMVMMAGFFLFYLSVLIIRMDGALLGAKAQRMLTTR